MQLVLENVLAKSACRRTVGFEKFSNQDASISIHLEFGYNKPEAW
jgi:hypothetical protein